MNTQDNNKPSRLSLALLFVICAVLTVPAVLVFLQLNSEPVTKPGRFLGFYIEGVLGSPGGLRLICFHLQIQIMTSQKQWSGPSQFARMGLILYH